MNVLRFAVPLLLLLDPQAAMAKPAVKPAAPLARVVRSDAEWAKLLTPQQFEVLRRSGTERAFTGECWNEQRRGRYLCAGCGLDLFASAHKFESGTGWPSFWKPAPEAHVLRLADTSLGMPRTALECARCGGHLGHVFDDGPRPTGQRYCINSAALRFVPAR